jgi:hypothetical protein
MEAMEHNEAVRLQAVEKYILGELSPSLRDEFETHYFDCAVCSFNLRAGVAFVAGTRQFFSETQTRTAAPIPKPGWFAWLKPMIAVPVLAALVLLVGYQNLVSIPQLKQAVRIGSQSAPITPWFSLVNASVFGSAGTRVEIPQGQGFYLFFDITKAPRQTDSIFLLQVQDSNGKAVINSRATAEQARKSIVLAIPSGFQEGDYKLIILDQAGGRTTPAGELPFTVAFSAQIKQH